MTPSFRNIAELFIGIYDGYSSAMNQSPLLKRNWKIDTEACEIYSDDHSITVVIDGNFLSIVGLWPTGFPAYKVSLRMFQALSPRFEVEFRDEHLNLILCNTQQAEERESDC